MATTAYEKLPVPGVVSPTGTFVDPEILYSTAGHTQKGVTLAGGQGILPAGCVLARKTSDKKYYAYNNAGAGGLEVARGVLRRGADTGGAGSPDQLGNIVIAGILRLSALSGADSAALVDLGAVTNTVMDTFKF